MMVELILSEVPPCLGNHNGNPANCQTCPIEAVCKVVTTKFVKRETMISLLHDILDEAQSEIEH